MTDAVVVPGAAAAAVFLFRSARRSPVRARVDGHRPAWRLPAPIRAPLARWLRDLPVDPETAVRAVAAAELVIVVTALGVAPVLVLPAGVLTIAAGPVAVALVRARARRQFHAALPGFVEQTAARLRAGHSVVTALDDAGAGPGPVAADARRCTRRLALGASLPDALATWASERSTDDARAVAGALVVAVETGAGAAPALDGLARSLRDQAGARADAAAWTAQARLSAVVVGLAPVGFVAFSAVVDPRSVTVLVATGFGRACLLAGLVLDALGGWWMHRIVRSEP